ncbi:phage tail sheath C-terminal domain-containing protein [Limnobaculum xujianqingii]|uniref:phage tail sheath C-terminal domain-containing protein n=1 Tax=Limnobaculum xujianqingii TaxID=2738837 RepID=UPI00112BA2CB|nr:phage tail sheath C-terminal domain-containing protein [Limnobaculum xujianqingii]
MTQIDFDTIKNSIRKPGVYTEFNTRTAVNTLPGNPQRMLVIAPMLVSGSVPSLKPVPVFSDVEAENYFGAGSLAHIMTRAAIKANAYLQLDVIGLPNDGAGQAATGTLKITGTATKSGTLSVWVSGERVDISIDNATTAATVSGALVTALTQKTDLLVSAALATDTITLTCKTKGAWGNDIQLRAVTTATGLTLTVAAMTGGELDPDIQPALDAVFAAGHHVLACPFSTETALNALSDHLTSTGSAMEQRGAVGCAGWTGTSGTGITLASSVDDGRISMPWYRGSEKLPAILASAYAAVLAAEEDPAQPFDNVEIVGMDVVALEDRISRNEQEMVLYNGLTPIQVGPGNAVQIVRAISTYTVNPAGIADPALLDITTIRTLDYVRTSCNTRLGLRFPNSKKTNRTRARVWSELYDVLLKLEDAEIIENVEANKGYLIVQENGQDVSRYDCVIPSDVVNGLHVIASRIDLYL